MDSDKTLRMSVGCVTKTSRLDFGKDPDLDPAYQWDTKHKLFSLAEVGALQNAVLVYTGQL